MANNAKSLSQRAALANDFDMSPLTRLVGFNIGLAYLLARRTFKKRVSAFKLSPLEYSILTLLANKKVYQARLSAALDIPSQNLTQVLDQLEKRGLVLRARNETDRRVQDVQRTEEGTALMRRVEEAVSIVEQEVLAPLSEGEAAIFRELLLKVIQPQRNNSVGSDDGTDSSLQPVVAGSRLKRRL